MLDRGSHGSMTTRAFSFNINAIWDRGNGGEGFGGNDLVVSCFENPLYVISVRVFVCGCACVFVFAGMSRRCLGMLDRWLLA